MLKLKFVTENVNSTTENIDHIDFEETGNFNE